MGYRNLFLEDFDPVTVARGSGMAAVWQHCE
ncbi:hypothetical protein FHS12_003919 [Nocardioides albus]|uniref:Uncharacterized protein n=1 Tax=Nocardioides albus TaxID=1841 RepID=A0A7W5FAB2_9ACTN|nr:hypothetical protein [Nocardioides albus]